MRQSIKKGLQRRVVNDTDGVLYTDTTVSSIMYSIALQTVFLSVWTRESNMNTKVTITVHTNATTESFTAVGCTDSIRLNR